MLANRDSLWCHLWTRRISKGWLAGQSGILELEIIEIMEVSSCSEVLARLGK